MPAVARDEDWRRTFWSESSRHCLAASAFGDPGSIAAKRAEAQQVYGQIHELDASLGRADERVNLANIRLAQVRHDIAVNRHELRIAKRNLKRSQQQIAQRLVTLYTTRRPRRSR